MRKIFTLVTMALMALAVNAKDYKGTFNISIGGSTPIPVESTVTVNAVETTDDTLPYDIVLNNFTVPIEGLGNLTFEKITMPNVLADDTDGMEGYKYFQSGTYTAEIVGSPIPGVSVEITVNEGDGCRMNDENLSLDMVMNVTYAVFEIPVSATFTGTAEKDLLNQDFSDNMIVSLDNGESFLDDQLPATINVQEQEDGKYTFSIKNFAFGTMGIGNITATDIEGVEENGVIKLSAENKNITITDGDTPDMDWSFGKILTMANPEITLKAEIEGNGLNAKITIPVHIPGTIDMDVVVVFGADYIAAGIDHVTVTPNASGVDEIYDLSGRKLNELQKGINIVRKADGTTVKVLKR